MERRFKVGDRVKIIASPAPEKIGAVATIVRVRQVKSGGPTHDSGWFGILLPGETICVLDIVPQSHGGEVVYPPRMLAPYYDGNERVSWSECVWQPKQVRA